MMTNDNTYIYTYLLYSIHSTNILQPSTMYMSKQKGHGFGCVDVAFGASMYVLAEESTIEKATRKGQISRFLLYFHGGLYYILDSCACRPAFVRESQQLHKHLKTIYSLLIQLFLYTKKIVFFLCWTSFVFCHQKKKR